MNAPILPESTKPLPSLSDSELDRKMAAAVAELEVHIMRDRMLEGSGQQEALDRWLVQADIFAEIFRRETVRARYGSQNQVPQAIRQLRACLDKLDELLGEEHHG